MTIAPLNIELTLFQHDWVHSWACRLEVLKAGFTERGPVPGSYVENWNFHRKETLARKGSFTERGLQSQPPLVGLFGASISPKHNRSWYCIYFQWKANSHPALTALLPSHGQQHPAVFPNASSVAVLWEEPSQQQEQQSSSLGMWKHFWGWWACQKVCLKTKQNVTFSCHC